jgi:hypothetical protein
MEEEQLEAIDTSGESAPAPQAAAPPPEAPQPQAEEGAIPDVGQPMFGAREGRTPMRRGVAELGADAAAGLGRSVENVKNSVPGQITKRIISYLMGADAGAPHMIQEAAAVADPQGQMNASDRNIVAVQKTAETQGPEAAWKLVQANRVAYNAKQAFAYTALNGTQQKPADLGAAIDAANQAQSHVLDGSDVQFAPSQGGVTATVKSANGQTQQIPLSLDAFRQYLNIGRNGQYDRVMQDTVPGTLQKLTQSPGSRTIQAPSPRQRPAPQAEGGIDVGAVETPQTNFGKTPSTMNLTGSSAVQGRGPSAVEATNYGDELEARAQRMFPGITQEEQRNAWMSNEEQRYEQGQNKVDVAKAGAEGKVQSAQVAGQSREKVAETKAASDQSVAGIKVKGWQYASDSKKAAAQITADAKLAHDGNVDARQRLETARKAIATKRLTAEKLTPEETALEAQMTQGGAASARPASQQAPQQSAPAPQRQGSQQPPVPGAKLYKGQWYTRGPSGESVPVK